MNSKNTVLFSITIVTISFLILLISTTLPENKIHEVDVEKLIHVKNESLKTEIKNNLINYIWKNDILPNNIPTKIEKNISDPRFSSLKNLNSIDKFTIEMDYGVNSIVYLFNSDNTNNDLIIYHQGHRGDFIEGRKTIEFFLERNFSVMSFSMPLLGMNSQPIIEHSQINKIKLESHDQLELLESVEFSPIKFFIEPIIVSLNFIESNYNFNSIHMVGISGGGWTTTLTASIDERVKQSYSVAGSYPIFLRTDQKNIGDYEQKNPELYSVANYLDLYVMSATGQDRKFIQIFNKFDPCCFDGTSFTTYENEIISQVENFDEGYFKIYLDDTHKQHIISDNGLEIIINEIMD